MDYFIFRKKQFGCIPPFTVGRAGWDNWMIYNARKRMVPVVNGTKLIVAVHQNHDYSHCEGGRQAAYVSGPEVKSNLDILGNKENLMTVADSTWEIRDGKIRFVTEMIGFHLDRIDKVYPSLWLISKILRKIIDETRIWKILKKLRLKRK
jgi:hypothetical protein